MCAPVLPLELEREIFEFAAQSRPSGIPSLLLVARRVHIWIEPLLYRTMVVAPDPRSWGLYPPVIASETLIIISMIKLRESSSFFKNSVHHLCLYNTTQGETTLILSALTNVQNLWLYLPDSVFTIEQVAKLPMKHLHCRMSSLSAQNVHFSHPIFAQITHLAFFDVLRETTLQLSTLPVTLPTLHLFPLIPGFRNAPLSHSAHTSLAKLTSLANLTSGNTVRIIDARSYEFMVDPGYPQALDFTPVNSAPPMPTTAMTNQDWVLVPQDTNTFKVQSAVFPNMFTSYASFGVPATKPIHSQLVPRGNANAAVFSLQTVGGGTNVNIVIPRIR
ncbi:hypothetical protein B0H16DRAFT_1718739 [Mycena metata]|uniref:Uncharacterized protein n=1 Tax=Mycena metata TaxID=1033252 RepID=A0AAD7JGF9_9AGAR|nr:hypothetical protein B0H16DRAFT_1718739 [Mycena metata]